MKIFRKGSFVKIPDLKSRLQENLNILKCADSTTDTKTDRKRHKKKKKKRRDKRRRNKSGSRLRVTFKV